MTTFALSIGGSIIVPDAVNVDLIVRLVALFRRRIDAGDQFLIFVGGGKVCRMYMDSHRVICTQLGILANEPFTGRVGIGVTYANASLLLHTFTAAGLSVYPAVMTDHTRIIDFKIHPIAIGCGIQVGRSTDYDTVVGAHTHGILTVINLTDVDAVYDKPPIFPDAHPLRDLTWKQFAKVCGVTRWSSGMHLPFDPFASQFAQEHAMTVIIARGTDLLNLEHIFDGKPFVGTTIKPD